jgi:hypothetical protein
VGRTQTLEPKGEVVKTILAAGLLALASMQGAAQASVINTRPVSPLGDGDDDSNLQKVFDLITPTDSPTSIDAVQDQTPYAVFTNSASGGSVATFIIELAGGAGQQKSGIYDYWDPDNRAEIFSGSDTAGSQKIVTFTDTGEIKVNFVTVASGFTGLFGFYLETFGSVYFTQDSLNSGTARALVYQGDDTTLLKLPGLNEGTFSENEFIFAWEDGGDGDYQDMVYLVESITPVTSVVPEPATVALLGLGALTMTVRRRRA